MPDPNTVAAINQRPAGDDSGSRAVGVTAVGTVTGALG
jgi:hypothetical protein